MLTADDRKAMYVPAGFAHGFQTLEDDTEVLYQMSAFYSPEHARGVRWNDPAFAIVWPADERMLSERDRSYPDFVPPRS
jgi:dTDP-4-dehydrorhamnose 3,5-epimerase